MPGRSGVEVAHELLDAPHAPAIVFVTAYDEYALQAFEVSAIDYLVKPVDRERFEQVLGRVARRIARTEPLGHGAYRIVMQSGARFDSSPTYGARVQALLR